jgi:hypothetical protein
VAILVQDKVDFKAQDVTRDRAGNYMVKESVHCHHIVILNGHVLNSRAPNYMKHKLTNGRSS